MTHNNLAVVIYSNGQIDDARLLLERSIELDPALIEGHLNLARLLADAGERRAAAKHLRRVLELDGTHEAARAALEELDR